MSRVASMNPAPIRHLTLWRCLGCGELFDADDLEQVQPDGHDACPLCTTSDPGVAEVECITSLREQYRVNWEGRYRHLRTAVDAYLERPSNGLMTELLAELRAVEPSDDLRSPLAGGGPETVGEH